MTNKQATFLPSRDETWLIALPWIGGALTLIFWILGRFRFEIQITDAVLLLSSLVFLDSVHVIFTFVLFLSVPELKAWAKSPLTRDSKGWLKGIGPWGRTLTIAAFLGLLIWILNVSPATANLRGMATTWLLLELLGPAQHTLSQMKGISLCYNSSLKNKFIFTPREKVTAHRCEKLERFLFTALFWSEIIYWMPNIFELDQIQIHGIDKLEYLGGAVAVVSSGMLMINALFYPRQRESNKFLFIARVMLFPLKMLTAVGGITLRAAHGTEYLVVFRRMIRAANLPKPQKAKIFLITSLVSLAYVIPFCLTWPDAIRELTGRAIGDRLLVWAIFGTFILRFTHYYMDSILFKMSDPTTRLAVFPLLTDGLAQQAPTGFPLSYSGYSSVPLGSKIKRTTARRICTERYFFPLKHCQRVVSFSRCTSITGELDLFTTSSPTRRKCPSLKMLASSGKIPAGKGYIA